MEYCYYMKCGKIKGQLAINKTKQKIPSLKQYGKNKFIQIVDQAQEGLV